MAVTFHFQPGLQWGDGAPLGAEDLAFTARVGRDPNSGFANAHTWSIVSRVDVVGPTDRGDAFHRAELPVRRTRPVAAGASGGTGVRPCLRPGGLSCGRASTVTSPTNPGLYNGPYLITGYDTGTRVVLERNPNWHGKPPAVRPHHRQDHRQHRRAADQPAQRRCRHGPRRGRRPDARPGAGVAEAVAGPFHLRLQAEPDLHPYRPAARQPDPGGYPGPPRPADGHRPAEHGGQADGRARAGRQQFRQSAASRCTAPRRPPIPYDPVRARALLAEAGWKPGPDGICRNAAGERLSLEFSTSTGVRVRELLQQVMQSEWRRIGVETVIRNEPARTLFGETLKHRAFKGLAMFAWISSIESTPRQTLSSGQIPTAANNWGGGNYPGFRDADDGRRYRCDGAGTRPGEAAASVGARCSASMRSSCRCCRCFSGRTRMSGRSG